MRNIPPVRTHSLRLFAALCGWAMGLFPLPSSVSLAENEGQVRAAQAGAGPLVGGANRGPDGRYHWKSYRTGLELLADINLWRQQFGLSSWSYNEMTVHLAENAIQVPHADDLGPRVVNFLECLAKKRRFVDSVELAEGGGDDIPLTSDDSPCKRLPLPAHSVLEVHIVTLPRDAPSSRGKVINWNTILVDCALGAGRRRARQ